MSASHQIHKFLHISVSIETNEQIELEAACFVVCRDSAVSEVRLYACVNVCRFHRQCVTEFGSFGWEYSLR